MTKKDFVKGVKWTGFKSFFMLGLGPLSQLIKASFLSPYEFAYLAIINIIVALSHNFEQFGLNRALIQKKELRNEEITPLFLLNLAIGLILFFILNLFSNLISSIFQMPALGGYISIISWILLLQAPAIVFRAVLEREMKFKEIAFFQIILEVILFMVLWTFLFLGFGVKSVLFSQLIRAFISSSVLIALSYKTEFRISFKIDLGSLKYFISFGKFVFGRDAISFATKYFDELLVGFFMEPEVLGYYHFSKNIIQKISKLIKESFGNIFYSFITKINDIKSVSKEYFRVLNILYSISFPLFAGIIITIQLFIPIILGEEWIATIYYFRLFSLIAMFHVLSLGTASNLLDSLGKPDIPFKIRLISDVIYLTSLVVLAPLGINYVLGCYGLYIALKSFLLQKYAFKALGKKLLFLFPQTKKPLLSVGLMVFSVLIFQKLFIGFFPPIIILVFSMVIGILIYFISNWNLVKNGWKIMVNR